MEFEISTSHKSHATLIYFCKVTDNAWWNALVWIELNAIGKELQSGFAAGAIALRDGSATVGLVNCLNAHLTAHCHALAVSLLGDSSDLSAQKEAGARRREAKEEERGLRNEINSLVQELSVSHTALGRAAEVAQSLFGTHGHHHIDHDQGASDITPTSASLSSMHENEVLGADSSNVAGRATSALKPWPTYTVQQTRGILEDHVCEGAPQLVLALPWLQHLCACSAFIMVWQRAATSKEGLYALLEIDNTENDDGETKQEAPSLEETTIGMSFPLANGNQPFNKEALYRDACQTEIEASEAAAEKWVQAEGNANASVKEREDAAEAKEVALSESRALKQLFAMVRHPTGTLCAILHLVNVYESNLFGWLGYINPLSASLAI